MKPKDFPIFKTKTEGVTETFDLSDPASRRKYFDAKAGDSIEIIQNYLKDNIFIVYLIGKKNSGKGTYTKLFMEAVGGDKIAHISIGDTVRDVTKIFQDDSKKEEQEEIKTFLKSHYRGFGKLDEALDGLIGHKQDTLLTTELILTLAKREIDRHKGKALFQDGFPRDLDQVSYSLFFRDLIGYRYDPDMFVFISLPEQVVDERMKYRVICPTCQTPRNVRVLATKEVGYDKEAKEFYLKCDNEDCKDKGTRMVGKKGDDAGIESVRDRLTLDGKVMEKVLELEGIDKVFLRNAIPVSKVEESVDQYEVTPAYSYELGEDGETVKTIESPWVIQDDEGIDSNSLLAPPVALVMIKQIADILKSK